MEYKVSELASKAGVTKRTIHYYISKGLLMPPDGNGLMKCASRSMSFWEGKARNETVQSLLLLSQKPGVAPVI